MSRKTVIKFAIFAAFCAFAPILIQACSGPDTKAKYVGKVEAEIFNYNPYEETIVLAFMLGDTQLFDEFKEMENKHFVILKNQEKVTFNVEITSPAGG